jgi:hypothetical protein
LSPAPQGAGKPPTIESFAAVKFKGVKSLLKKTTKTQRTNYLHSLAQVVYQSAAIAGELCIHDKAEVSQLARDNMSTLLGRPSTALQKCSKFCAAVK